MDDIRSRHAEHPRHVVECERNAEAGRRLARKIDVEVADGDHRRCRYSAKLLEMSVGDLPAPDQRDP